MNDWLSLIIGMARSKRKKLFGSYTAVADITVMQAPGFV